MEIEAFVLIGGRSSRMGRDKALIKLDGITLAERAVDTIAETFPGTKISLVARDKDQFSLDRLPKETPVICDVYKDRGAYGALHAALHKAKSEWIFVLACDLPFVSVELLKIMAASISENFAAVAPVQPDGRIQPLCAFYRSEVCLKVIKKMIQADEKLPPLRAMFERISTRFLQADELKHLRGVENFFLNLNTPEELDQVW